ncbi:aminoacyl-tRNA hydrolase [Anaerolineae bacterium CFX9]|nr:aminoacyl-tRNA hydrolase [Anaerolineae bacterium CFX9]
MYLIVGLGNPGPRYERTRHNIGWQTLDRLALRHGLTFSKNEHHAQTASGTIVGQRVILAKPQTYMNLSGNSVAPLAHYYKITPDRILIVCDDLDLPLGTLRIRKGGSSGGQNGLRHIVERLGTQEIPRIRIGISRPPGRMDPADWVMTPFKGDDEILAVEMQDRAVRAIETWLTEGIELAMSRHNGSGEERRKKDAPKPAVTEPDTSQSQP